MAEDKALEPVSVIKENGAEDKELATDPKGEVAVEEKADKNNVEEMQLDKDPAKGSDTIDDKVKQNEKVEHNDDMEEEKNEMDKTIEKNEVGVEEGKNLDIAMENAEATETEEKEVEKKTETVEMEVEKETGTEEKKVEKETETEEKEVEKETESEEKEGEKETESEEKEGEKESEAGEKPDDAVTPNGISAEGDESGKNDEEEKELKKPGTGKSGAKKVNGKSKDVQEPKTPAVASFSIDRPVRERKSVERLVAIIERDSTKEFHIEKGNGTALKDIPNVAYKLSRRKSDDTLKLLHSILFSRRGKAADIKQHISKFSGFVWHGGEDKQKLKIKEKLEKINKEKLFEFCDILDVVIANKANIRKDEVVTMLLDFLITPHATTDDLLSEKDESSKGSKRKRADKGTPGSGSTKSQKKKKAETSKADDKTNSAETEDESVEDVKEKEDSESDEAVTVPEPKESTEELPKKSSSEEKLSEPDAQTDEDTQKKKRKRIPKKQIEIDEKTPKRASSSKKMTSGSTTETSKGKTKKTALLETKSPSVKTTPRTSKKPNVDADKVTSPKVSSKKHEDAKPIKEKGVFSSKEKAGKGTVSKGKEKTREEQVKPTDERVREEVCKILKEVDFNTATFTDLLKTLAERFKTDLTSRKSVIKVMIQEELTKLANEETDDEETEPFKDESHTPASQKV